MPNTSTAQHSTAYLPPINFNIFIEMKDVDEKKKMKKIKSQR